MALEYLIFVYDASWTLNNPGNCLGAGTVVGRSRLVCSLPGVVLVLGRAGVPFVSVGLKVGVCCCCRDLI